MQRDRCGVGGGRSPRLIHAVKAVPPVREMGPRANRAEVRGHGHHSSQNSRQFQYGRKQNRRGNPRFLARVEVCYARPAMIWQHEASRCSDVAGSTSDQTRTNRSSSVACPDHGADLQLKSGSFSTDEVAECTARFTPQSLAYRAEQIPPQQHLRRRSPRRRRSRGTRIPGHPRGEPRAWQPHGSPRRDCNRRGFRRTPPVALTRFCPERFFPRT